MLFFLTMIQRKMITNKNSIHFKFAPKSKQRLAAINNC